MLNSPKVTIYIPAYNYAKYVEKAIQSVCSQTFRDWELFVINDGSTDETEEILKKYESYEKVTIINQENKGLTVTNNIALRLARGQYFVRLDGDDFFDENALLVMSHYLDENKNIGLVYPDYYLVDELGEVMSVESRIKIDYDDGDVLLDVPAHGACTMFRTAVLREMGGYNEEISCQDGYDLWLRFIELYKVGNVNLPLFYYRQHGTSLTKNEKRILETRQKIKSKYAEIKRKKKKLENVKRVAIIPARTHSNVLMRMALMETAGKPLINYIIDEAIKTECFDSIVVVSEDDQIINHVNKQYPQHIIAVKRPLEYARRNTGLDKTVQLVLERLLELKGERYEEGVLLYVEAPLKRSEHIIKAIDTMHLFETDSVIPLCETSSPYYVREKNGLKRIGGQEKFRLERKIIYKDNGSFFVFKVKNLSEGKIAGQKIGHVIMLREDSIKIESPFDFKVTEFLLQERQKEVTRMLWEKKKNKIAGM